MFFWQRSYAQRLYQFFWLPQVNFLFLCILYPWQRQLFRRLPVQLRHIILTNIDDLIALINFKGLSGDDCFLVMSINVSVGLVSINNVFTKFYSTFLWFIHLQKKNDYAFKIKSKINVSFFCSSIASTFK